MGCAHLLIAVHSEVVVSEEELPLSVPVHGAILIVVRLIHGEQIIINGRVKVFNSPIQGPSASKQL